MMMLLDIFWYGTLILGFAFCGWCWWRLCGGREWINKCANMLKNMKKYEFCPLWGGIFIRNPDCCVVLHLEDERRLYGRANVWPASTTHGFFAIEDPEWTHGDERRPCQGVKYTLVKISDVRMVEIMYVKNSD